MSTRSDDAYMVHGRSAPHLITTIPGQPSKERDYAINRAFGEDAFLEGVVFVACNGYDYIWNNTDVAASGMSNFDLDSLRKRNMRHELDSFTEICRAIMRKKQAAPPDFLPKWLLVVANKADLYWNNIDPARQYYEVGQGSEFGERTNEFLMQIGTMSPKLSYPPSCH